jgi:hypothetical protein
MMRCRPRRLLVAAALALLLPACAKAPAAPLDEGRGALLGALPDTALARGVHLVDRTAEHPLAPSSAVAPLLGGLLEGATLHIETSAPPLVLLAGVSPDAVLPATAVRLAGDVVVLGSPEETALVRERFDAGAMPEGVLRHLAVPGVDAGWFGPLPPRQAGSVEGLGDGTAALVLAGERLRIHVAAAVPAAGARDLIERRLADGAPPGSPGKPWTSLLPDAAVTAEGDEVTISARPEGWSGPFLRTLLDSGGLTFLAR